MVYVSPSALELSLWSLGKWTILNTKHMSLFKKYGEI